MKLTDGKGGTIAKAEAPAKGQRLIADEHRDAPRGFCLRVTAAGGKAFVLRYRIDGAERRKTIGQWPTWSVEAARIEARKLAVQIDGGDDPLEEKRKRRAEPTVADLAEEWLDRQASGLKSAATVRSLVKTDILPALGKLKVTDVRRRDVIDMVEAKAETAPRSAGQLLIYARRMLTYAADREIIPFNPAADLKPASITVKGQRDPLRQNKRERVLDADEIRALWANAETCGMHRMTALALKMILVTGQRPGEVAGMHADEINGRVWTIPSARRGKTETAHAVHLTDTALEILDAAAEARRHRAGHIFQARRGEPLERSTLTKSVPKYTEALGNKADPTDGHWRPHDLRRTMRTGLSACGFSRDVAKIVTGHVIPGVDGIYDRHHYRPERKAALEAWEHRLGAILEGRDPDAADGNVIPLEAAR